MKAERVRHVSVAGLAVVCLCLRTWTPHEAVIADSSLQRLPHSVNGYEEGGHVSGSQWLYRSHLDVLYVKTMYVHNHKGTARVAATLLKGYSAEAWPSELGAGSPMRQSSLGNQLFCPQNLSFLPTTAWLT